jgi:F-type H+-transporting ATPase subunit a
MIASGFSWFHLIPPVGHDTLVPGLDHGTYLLFTTWFVCLLLIGFALVARSQLQAATSRAGIEKYYADSRFSARTIAELIGENWMSLLQGTMGHADAKRFFPLTATLFTYILACNLMALIPGMQPPTDNVNTNVGMAVMVFLVFNYVGLSRDARGYLGHMWGPVPLLGLLLFPIELISLCLRPMTLTLRLFGNIFGDHTVFGVISGFPPYIGVPSVFLGLAVGVSFIQAFVFALLSSMYIGLAMPHHEHADDHHH